MPSLIEHLRKENGLILSGLGLLSAYRDELLEGRKAKPEDLRMAVYAMQLAFETSHVSKQESILVPALLTIDHLTPEQQSVLRETSHEYGKGRDALLSLRLAIDDFERNSTLVGILAWRLGAFIDHVRSHIGTHDTFLFTLAEQHLSVDLLNEMNAIAQSFEHSQGIEKLQSPIRILSYLRSAKGLGAA